MNGNCCQRQRGVAIITVLLIVALVSILAMQMTDRLQYQLRRSQMLLSLDQAQWINLGAEAFAEQVLDQDFKDADERVHLGQYWASGAQQFPLDDGGMLRGQIYDRQACFNLNAVGQEKEGDNSTLRTLSVRQIQALFEAQQVDAYQAEQMADTLADWIDEDDVATGNMGAEDSEYGGKSVPYLTANSPLVDIGELPEITGFNGAVMRKIASTICVLPQETSLKINVNTVTEPAIFVALFTPALSMSQAEELIRNRPVDGYKTVEDFLAESALSGIPVDDKVKGELDISSSWFEVKAETYWGGTVLASHSLLKRNGKNSWIVIRRQLGGLGE